MNRLLKFSATASLVLATALAQPIPLYENHGFNDFGNRPPQIDATAFVNFGTFGVTTGPLPFDFQNTRHFTNHGVMFGSVGFLFDTAFTDRPRQRAFSFVNHRGAQVDAFDGFGFGGFFFGIPFFPGEIPVFFPGFAAASSLMLITADEIVNHGLLSVGANGRLLLRGNDVDLTRGGMEATAIRQTFAHFVTPTNFWPDVGIYDNYWGIGDSEVPINVENLITGDIYELNAQSPPHLVTNAFSFFGFQTSISLNNAVGFAYTNTVPGSDTNWIVQAVVIGNPDPNIGVDVRFTPSEIATNFMQTATVEFALADTNIVTGELEFITIYLLDQLASWTNFVALTNLVAFPETQRPANYEVTRSPPFEWVFGDEPNAPFHPGIFVDPPGEIEGTLASNIVTNHFYAGYSFEVDPLPSQPFAVPGLTVTDLPGRVEIEADNLDLTRARIRANALLSVQASNLVSSSRAQLDSLHLNFHLGHRAGNLVVQDLAPEVVRRLGGTVRAWSGVWTNFYEVIEIPEPPEPDPEQPDPQPPMPVTNLVEVAYHALFVDTGLVRSENPVTTHDFVTSSTSVRLDDRLTVVRSFITDAERFTINGRLSLGEVLGFGELAGVRNWFATNAPNLLFLTNNGVLSIDNTAFFGNDRPRPYESFVNRGSLEAASITVHSGYFENSGEIFTFGGFGTGWLEVEAREVALLEGMTLTAGEVRITADSIFIREHVIDSGLDIGGVSGAVFLSPRDRLDDGGADAGNLWISNDGFHILRTPFSGDLLGTTIVSEAPRFRLIPHTWAGRDLGASPAGFNNNLALGTLVLDGNVLSTHRFQGAAANNALYVEFLELQGAILAAFFDNDLEDALEIAPGMRIYFADSNVPPEELDGLINGRLRWVPFAGPASSVEVTRSSGETVLMNRALRESMTIDSDGDGIVNGLDPFPLDPGMGDPAAPQVVLQEMTPNDPPPGVSFSFQAQPSTTYHVEYSADLKPGAWKLLSTYVNDSSSVRTAVIKDSTATESQRYYRVLEQK
jgi:hypothetical protein